MFRQLRILILLLILLFVAMGAWLDRARSTAWEKTLWIAIYPIAAEHTPTVERYLGSLSSASFAPIADFTRREARRYGISLSEPAKVVLYDRVTDPPPQLARDAGALKRAYWSLRTRYWAWRTAGKQNKPPPDIRMFVLYHDPAIVSTVPHSTGLQKGLLGIVHAFADPRMTDANSIVIAHEFLHTLGALDKYDLENRPLFPIGYAEPERQPLYPQEKTEIMAGRRMVDATRMEMPASLDSVIVGPATALEIGWKAGGA